MIEKLFGLVLCNFAKLLTGVHPLWQGCKPEAKLRVYFANHRSHGDFVVIWAALPAELRRQTRPVAGADYWLDGRFKIWLINEVFHAVLVDRRPDRDGPDPVEQMAGALRAGNSLILFPEGTRNTGESLLPFKSGIFHLAQAMPRVELVPVWIENLGRVMPKGATVPVPLLCTLTFGVPLTLTAGETKAGFLDRARNALLDLAPPAN
ncbi:lysophospholipid acyltransferase family protein [Accumulibacter sp.]|uniref:lysophospholipid acyltransferase family protein n=1 Tax=Accumulibacter sp. TaxID=2053492 RepID=UPI0026186DFB|nr:lysophospholipid acyltransferase family protein [Accumulibacter sp.]